MNFTFKINKDKLIEDNFRKLTNQLWNVACFLIDRYNIDCYCCTYTQCEDKIIIHFN